MRKPRRTEGEFPEVPAPEEITPRRQEELDRSAWLLATEKARRAENLDRVLKAEE